MPAFHADWIGIIPYFHVLSNLALGRHSINVIRFSKEGKKKEKVFGGESGEGKGKEMRDNNAKWTVKYYLYSLR